jgi:hypothetical protein
VIKNRVIVEHHSGGSYTKDVFEDGVVWATDHMVRIRNAERTRALWLRVEDVFRISEEKYESPD